MMHPDRVQDVIRARAAQGLDKEPRKPTESPQTIAGDEQAAAMVRQDELMFDLIERFVVAPGRTEGQAEVVEHLYIRAARHERRRAQ